MSIQNENLNGNNSDETENVSSISHIQNPETLKEIYQKLFSVEGKTTVEHIIAKIEESLGRISGARNAKISYRLKAPISILKKYISDEKYQGDWNKIKDLIGFMVIVDTNNDLNDVLTYFDQTYKKSKNKYSSDLITDFRTINIRTKKPFTNEIGEQFDSKMEKGYQISDGYKSTRVNLMIDDYPIEIQVKTKAQYVAHEATYDTIYKTTDKLDEGDNTRISDYLFPYFELLAHITINNPDKQSPVFDDLEEIYKRNRKIYEKYPDIFNDACKHFAGAIFSFKYGDEIIKEYNLGSKVLNHKLLSYDIIRLFKMIEKDIQEKHPELAHSETLNKTIQYICSMDLGTFKKLRKNIMKSFRNKSCVLTGVFDDLTTADIDFIENLNESFHNVIIGVYNDELAELYLGHKPKFNESERAYMMSKVKGIHAVHITDNKGQTDTSDILQPYHTFLKTQKPYDLIYLPLGTAVPTPETIEYIENVSEYTKNIIIGIKSDQYAKIFGNEEPYLNEIERAHIYKSIMGVCDVSVTSLDAIPPEQVLTVFSEHIKNGKKVAILKNPFTDNTLPIEKQQKYFDEYFPSIKFEELSISGKPDSKSKRETIPNPYEFVVSRE